MENQYADQKQLLQKYRSGTCTFEEKLLVENWYNQQSKNASFKFAEPDYELLRREIWDRLPAAHERKSVIKAFGYRWLSVAAAILVLIGGGIFFFRTTINVRQNALVSVSPVVKNGVVLTLSDGKKIDLTDVKNGAVAQQMGVRITKSEDGTLVYTARPAEMRNESTKLNYNTIETPKGRYYQINLPDGTRAWLNAASSLKYPTSFAFQKNRRVELLGEAYFEVAKDKSHPFLVKTAGQEIEVLGTHFNVMAYGGEQFVKTTLLEGAVRITGKDFTAKLKAGELAVNDLLSGKINISATEAEDAIAWKNGYFNFDNVKIEEVMRQVARWYDVDVELKSIDRTKAYWVANYPKSSSLEGLLKSLEITGDFQYKIIGRRVVITQN